MTNRSVDGDQVSVIVCALTWRLVRQHGWSRRIEVSDLARDCNYSDEKAIRDIIRNELANKPFVTFHKGKDQIWIRKQDKEDIRDYLTKSCGYKSWRVSAKLDSNR
jgi:hypothetical protein